MISGPESFKGKITSANLTNIPNNEFEVALTIQFFSQGYREKFEQILVENSLNILKNAKIQRVLNALKISMMNEDVNEVLKELSALFDYNFESYKSLFKDNWIDQPLGSEKEDPEKLRECTYSSSDDYLRPGSVPLCVHQYPNRHGGVNCSSDDSSDESEEDIDEEERPDLRRSV